MIAATTAGFFVGPTLVANVPHWVVGGMEALVAGGLLHVALNPQNRDHACDGHAVDALADVLSVPCDEDSPGMPTESYIIFG